MEDIAILDQSSILKGKRIFTLQDDGILRVTHAEVGRSQEMAFDLAALDPRPVRERAKATGMVVGMVIFGVAVFAFVFAAFRSGNAPGSVAPLLCLAGFFALPILLCWHQYLQKSYDLVIFRNPFSGGQIGLRSNVPSPDEFSAFVDKLVSEINTSRMSSQRAVKSLSDELRDLARLHQDGVLTEGDFETAKRNLIDAAKEPGPVGFGAS